MTSLGLARIAVVAPVTLAAAWFAGAFTIAAVMSPGDPVTAAAMWPTDIAVAGRASALVSEDPSHERATEAVRLGKRVLARSPVNAEAARAVALGRLELGDYAGGRAAIGLAEALSRRDVPTQTWLIEERVQAGDVAGALVHYDRVLRTHPEIGAVILPVLARAANDPAIARPLAARLAVRPEWWSDFLGRFLASATSPDAILLVADGLRLDPASEIDRARLVTILARLTALGDVGRARALHDRATRLHHDPVVDGGFEHDGGLPPFDWQIADNGDTSATREPRDGAIGTALSLAGTEGKEVARQLLVLPPGRYHFQARVAGVGAGTLSPPTVALACSDGNAVIATAPFPGGEAPHPMGMDFTVPGGCPGQWLIIGSAANVGSLSERPWIDDVAVRRIDGGKPLPVRPGTRG